MRKLKTTTKALNAPNVDRISIIYECHVSITQSIVAHKMGIVVADTLTILETAESFTAQTTNNAIA